MKILNNKRLHLVFILTWLVASFFIVRIPAINSADDIYRITLSTCYQHQSKLLTDNCVANASDDYRKLLEISNAQLFDMLVTFLIPIVLIFFILTIVKWINNYDEKK